MLSGIINGFMRGISGFTGNSDNCDGGWESSQGYGGGVVNCRGSDGCSLWLLPTGEAVVAAPSADAEGPGLKSLLCTFEAWATALGLEGPRMTGLLAAAEAAADALVLVAGTGMTGLLAALDEAGPA